MNDTSTQAPNRWLHYIIVALIAGAVGTGSALFVTSRQNAPASTMVPLDDSTSGNSSNAPFANAPDANAPDANAPISGAPSASAPVANAQSPSDAIAAASAGNTAQAVPPADLTSGLTPAQASVRLGNWHFDAKNFAQAIIDYRQAIALGSDNPDIRTDLGSALRFADQPREALEQYQIAQKQNPNHQNSLYNQGGLFYNTEKLHLLRDDPKRAASIWRQYLARFPQGDNVAVARQLLAEVQPKIGASTKTRAPKAKTR